MSCRGSDSGLNKNEVLPLAGIFSPLVLILVLFRDKKLQVKCVS